MEPILQEHSPKQSDSDDWTLVSFKTKVSAPSNPQEDSEGPENHSNILGDDQLIEVDLEQSSGSVGSSFERLNEELMAEELQRTSNDLNVPGFQALDTSDGEVSQSDSRRSSVSQPDSETSTNLSRSITAAELINTNNLLTRSTGRRVWQDEEFNDAEESEVEIEERGFLYDSASSPVHFLTRPRTPSELGQLAVICFLIFSSTVFLIISTFFDDQVVGTPYTSKNPRRKLMKEFSRYSENQNINIAPELFKELQTLDDELSKCVKRQSPSWYKYYMSEERFSQESESKIQPTMKHYNGLVCYGQETQWRERFNKLREKKNLDLSKMMQDAKRAVANDLLGYYHPTLQFKLILNQLEYLEFLENKRNKKKSEETIKYLKVENMQLYRQLSDPSKSTGAQKLTKSLEWDNLSLRRELDDLKARMNLKAGPSYIRQSQELEQYERENVLLKQFLYDISRAVSVISKQFNLNTIDTPINLNNLEVLKFHTKTTKEYLAKVNTKVSDVLLENKGLKEELSDNYRLITVNKSISPAFQDNVEQESFIMRTNQSDALMKDSCIQNLLKFQEQATFLENENKYLRNCCSKTSDKSLATLQDSSLNVTKETIQQEPTGIHRQIAALATGLERRIRNAVTLAGSRSFDELSLFLEEFSNRIKSTTLIPKEPSSLQSTDDETTTAQSKVADSKTIPNYMTQGDAVTPEFQPTDHQIIMHEPNFIGNPALRVPSIQNSWFFKRAMQRKLLRNVKYDNSKESRLASRKKLGKYYPSSDCQTCTQKRPTKHTFANSKNEQRKSKKTADKARKIKGQKYSRSEL